MGRLEGVEDNPIDFASATQAHCEIPSRSGIKAVVWQSRAIGGPFTPPAVSGTSKKKERGCSEGCTVWLLQIHLSSSETLHPTPQISTELFSQ